MEENKASYEQLEQENQELKEQIENIETSKKFQKKAAKWTLRKGAGVFLGKGLKDAIKQTLTEFNTDKKVSTDTASNLGAHVIWRLTRIGIFAIILSILPISFLAIQTIYLGKQNQKIDKQNELITNQNIRLEQQTYLQEAGRRSSLVFLSNNVLDKMDEELKDTINNKNRELSDQLIGRIVALSKSLKPYKYLENDSLSMTVSPERGQLLVNLTKANLGSKTYSEIFKYSDFSYSEITNFTFHNDFFGDINLSNSKFTNVQFNDCKFFFVNFTNCLISDLTFQECTIYEIDFTESLIESLSFDNTQTKFIKIDYAYVNDLSLINTFVFYLSFYESLVNGIYTYKGYIDYFKFIQNDGRLSDYFESRYPEKYKILNLFLEKYNYNKRDEIFICQKPNEIPLIYDSKLSKASIERMKGIFNNNFRSVKILSKEKNFDSYFPKNNILKEKDSTGIIYSNNNKEISRESLINMFKLKYRKEISDFDSLEYDDMIQSEKLKNNHKQIIRLLSNARRYRNQIDIYNYDTPSKVNNYEKFKATSKN